MKKTVFASLIACALFVTFGCNDNSSSKLTLDDSLRIANLMAARFPEISGKTENVLPTKALVFARPSEIIDNRTATTEHLAYLTSPAALRNSDNQVVHSLWINKPDLAKINSLADSGARLSFCLNVKDGVSYISLIMTAMDVHFANKLLDNEGHSAIVNKLEPCPNYCPGGNETNDDNDLNTNQFMPGQTERLWYRPNSGGWVKKNYRRPVSGPGSSKSTPK